MLTLGPFLMVMENGNGSIIHPGGHMPKVMDYQEKQRQKLFGELWITNGMIGEQEQL